MRWRGIALLLLLPFAVACGSRVSQQEAHRGRIQPLASKTPEADRNYRPPNMLWWQGAQPQCAGGELNERTLRWGAVLWCKLPGQSVDANLQNDLGRLARCVHESVEAFQSEPGEDGLGKFLNRAKAEGLSPILCGAVRNDSEVRIYNGRTVLLERVVVKSLPDANGASRVRYRFGCEDCLVASETTIEVSL